MPIPLSKGPKQNYQPPPNKTHTSDCGTLIHLSLQPHDQINLCYQFEDLETEAQKQVAQSNILMTRTEEQGLYSEILFKNTKISGLIYHCFF